MSPRNQRTLPAPRTWIAATSGNGTFGRKKAVTWQSPLNKNDRALIEAARIQHDFAKAVRAQLTQTRTTETVAAASGLTIDQVRRILRGEVHLTLANMRLIATHAGLNLTGGERTP